MSLREENNYEKARREKLGQRPEDDYDMYLFWPSLSNRNLSPGDPPSSPLYGVYFSLFPKLGSVAHSTCATARLAGFRLD